MASSSTQNEYKVSFVKTGLSRREFQGCLHSKVEEVLGSFQLAGIKTLMNSTVNEIAKKVCLRVNETNPYTLDRRHTSTSLYHQKGILGGANDPPRRCVQRTSGIQGIQRADRAWKDHYHNEQHTFFSLPFIQGKLGCHFPEIILKNDTGKKGYLFERSSDRMLTTNEFCNVIHQITLDLGKELSILRRNVPGNSYSNQQTVTLDAVSRSCKKILMRRLALHWAVDNDLMDSRSYEIWRDHVKVVIAFAALWVVADMMVARLNKGWRPDPKLTATTLAMWYAATVGIPVAVSLLCTLASSRR